MSDGNTSKTSVASCSNCNARLIHDIKAVDGAQPSAIAAELTFEGSDDQSQTSNAVPTLFEEIVEEGKALFILYLQQELERNGFRVKLRPRQSSPLVITDSDDSIDDKEESKTSILTSLSDRYKETFALMQQLIEDFSATKERENIRSQANEMDLQNINEEMYYQRLRQVTSEGITQDRIVQVFCFAGDVAVAMIKMKLGPVVPIIQWTQKFLAHEICIWVEEHGGWDVVLGIGMEYAGRHGYLVAGGLGIAFVVLAVLVRSVWLLL